MTEKKEKSGLAIAFITNGMISVKWMMRLNELNRGIPSGMFWRHIWHEGKDYRTKGGYAKARNIVVEKAMEINVKYLFFIDTDVFPNTDIITRLMSHNKPIVTGIYYMKSYPAQPVIFQKMGDGPYWNYPVEELFEIGGAGLGCTFIDMEVFDKFKEKGLPFFKEDWKYKKDDGSTVSVNVGEDHWFFMKAKELGYKVYCDSSCLCDHVEEKNGATFPGEKETKKIREMILKKHGRGDIIEREKELFKRDPEKKTIVFYNMTLAKFTGDTIKHKPIGGSEGDIINLAKMFAKKYNVFVFCHCTKPGIYDNVHYFDVKDTESLRKWKTDLFISSRNTVPLGDGEFKDKLTVGKKCLWTHDLPDSYVFDKLPDAIRYENISKIFALTEWHKEIIKQKFPMIPEGMLSVARNGVDTEYYAQEIERNPFKLIYSSTPFRGLDVLLNVFPKIKELVPEAELHIFSSMKVYGAEKEPEEFQALYNKAKEMEGVVYHGSVTRKELAKEMKSSAILAYPNHYPETCCNTAMEAITAGTPIVTTNKAALSEIVPKDCGILIDGDSHSKEYQDKFIDSIARILKNKPLWNQMHDSCKKYDFSWETISKEWIKEFFPEDLEEYSKTIDKDKTKVIDEDKTPKQIDQEDNIISDKEVNQDDARRYRKKVMEDLMKATSTTISPDIVEEEPEKTEHPFNMKTENINTPAYWNNQYRMEIDKGFDQRSDPRRWNILLDHIKDGDVILDYGCATGEFLLYTKPKKPNCKRYGIDFSDYAIKTALKRDPTLRAATDIKGFPAEIRQSYFNVITSQHVIEHMSEPIKHVEDLRKMLTKDGTLILVIPIKDDEWSEHQMIWKLEDIVELLSRFECTYNIIHRKKTLRRRKDNNAQEAIVVIKFKE